MLRITKAALAVIILPLLLSGCWDLKDLQEVNYIRTIGFDLKGEELVVYAQLLDFNSVAKVEGGRQGGAPAWIGIGRGATLTAAIEDLYRVAQLRLYYGHINAVVLSESLLKKPEKAKEVYEFISRYYEIRYTPWIYGTRQPVDKLFAVTSLFHFSQNVSIMHQPSESYKQRSLTRPMSIRQFNVDLREPGRTTLLPSMTINEDNMKRGDKNSSMLEINGAYVFNRDVFQGWMSNESLRGVPWVEPETVRAPVTIYSEGKIAATLFLESPKVKIHPHVQNGRVTYTMDIELSGHIAEMLTPLSETAIERKAEEQVKKEVLNTFNEGLKRKVDLLQLEQALYRQNNGEWKKLRSEGMAEPKADSLTDVKVIVKLTRYGKTKSRKTMHW